MVNIKIFYCKYVVYNVNKQHSVTQYSQSFNFHQPAYCIQTSKTKKNYDRPAKPHSHSHLNGFVS